MQRYIDLSLSSLIWRIRYAEEKEGNISYVKIFEDDGQYWLLYTDGRWTTLNKEDPEGWIVEDLVHEYLSLLYAANNFTDKEWETRDYVIAEDAKRVTIIIELDKNKECITL